MAARCQMNIVIFMSSVVYNCCHFKTIKRTTSVLRDTTFDHANMQHEYSIYSSDSIPPQPYVTVSSFLIFPKIQLKTQFKAYGRVSNIIRGCEARISTSVADWAWSWSYVCYDMFSVHIGPHTEGVKE